MSSKVVKANPRAPLVDTIRGISILVIVAYHIIQRWPFEVGRLTCILTSFGSYGVDIFFALSGFLVGISTSKSFDSPDLSFQFRHLLNRLFRVYLPYAAALILFFAGISVLRPATFHISFLTLTQNYLIYIPFFKISWFLCILFYFYILAFLLTKIPGNSAVISSIMMFVLTLGCVVSRLLVLSSGQLTGVPVLDPSLNFCNLYSESKPFGYFFTATHLRSDSILLACSLGLVFQRFRARFEQLKPPFLLSLILLSVIPLVVAHLHSFQSKYLFAPLFAAIFSTLVSAFCYLDLAGLGFLRVSTLFAKISVPAFSLYLTHSLALEVATIVHKKFLLNQPLIFALLLALIGVFTAFFYMIIEKPSKLISSNLAFWLTNS